MSVDIEAEAKRFWREQCFYNICCDNDDCVIDIVLVGNEIVIDMVDHGYSVTIQRYLDCKPAQGWHSEGTLKHSNKEIDFWTKVTELYYTVPLWMFEFDDLEDVSDECSCEITTIVQQGCQCGGI